MKKDILKETISGFKTDMRERIKLPVLVSYGIIVVIYNWDVLYYLIFKDEEPFQKITFIKKTFNDPYYIRFFCPLLVAVIVTFLFPVVQVFINICLQKFKKKDDELKIQEAKQTKEIIDIRAGNKEKEELQSIIESQKKTISSHETLMNELKVQIEDFKVERNKMVLSNDSTVNNLENLREYLKSTVKNYFNTSKLDDVKRFSDVMLHFNSLDVETKSSFIKVLDILNKEPRSVERELKDYLEEAYNGTGIISLLVEKSFIKSYSNKNRERIIEITDKGKEFIMLYNILYK